MVSSSTLKAIYLFWQNLKHIHLPQYPTALAASTMHCLPFLLFRSTGFPRALQTSSLKKGIMRDFMQVSGTCRTLLEVHPGKDHSYLPPPLHLGRPPLICCFGSSESTCFHHQLAFLFPGLSSNKRLYAVHMADIFDTHSEEGNNQCIQHITQYLENRFVFPLAYFEVRGIQMAVKHLTAIKGHFLRGKTCVCFY